MKIENVLEQITYNKVQSKRLVTNGAQQVNILSLEQGAEIPAHTSTKDATVVVLEGKMNFSIDHETSSLNAMDTISFGANNEHSLEAVENVKFLLIQ